MPPSPTLPAGSITLGLPHDRLGGRAVFSRLTKDADFPALLARHGPPPQIIWVTCGNTSNSRLRGILNATLPEALSLLASGEPLVEIGDA